MDSISIEEFPEWKEEGLTLLRRIVGGAERVLELSGGGPNIEASKQALKLLEEVESQEEWSNVVDKTVNPALQKVGNELQYRFGMSLEAAFARYG